MADTEENKSKNYKCEICDETYTVHPSVHDKGHIQLIQPGLYLGASWNAKNKKELDMFKIRTIINMTVEFRNFFPDTYKYKRFYWDDVDGFIITPDLKELTDSIHESISKGENVLVHCMMGRSRSVAAIIAYLMKYCNKSCSEAFDIVKSRNPNICPKKEFLDQIKIFVGSK